MPPHNARSLIAGLALAALVAGCNGGSGNRPAPRAAPATSPAVADNSDAPAEPVPAPRKPNRKVTTAEESHPSLDPNVNPLDIFVSVPEESRWEIVQAEGKRASADDFTAILPPKGVDSTHFEPLNPPEASATPTASARRVPPAKVAPVTDPEPPSSSRKSSDRKTRTRASAGRRAGEHKGGDRKEGERKSARKLAERKEEEKALADQSGSEENKTLPAGFTPLTAAKDPSLGWPLRIRSDRDGAEMVLVNGGVVTVGHNGEPAESSPQLSVVVDSYYMDVTEVTVGQYERFRTSLKEERGRSSVGEPKNAMSPHNFPVLGVTLTQAQFYARWAGKEIPTEAEWERAARGEAAFDHPWGNGRAIWKHARTPDEIDPVKSFRTDVSPFGIYDLAGNAREWCIDNYSPTAFADAMRTASGQLRNWKGPRMGHPENAHVVKGNGPHWDAWYRTGMDGSHTHSNVGFRCVLRLPGKVASPRE